MATVRKSKTKKIVVPICILLVIAIIVSSIVIVNKNKSVETVTLATIATDGITETVSATGDVTSGAVKEYKAATTATCKEVFVKVGDKVKKDDILATFDTDALDSQIASLQSTYSSSSKAYSDAVANQKNASEMLEEVNKQIAAVEKELKKAKKAAQTTTKATTKATTTTVAVSEEADVDVLMADAGDPTSPSYTLPTDYTMPSVSVPTTVDYTIPDYSGTFASLAESLAGLVETINSVSQSVEDTNMAIQLVMGAVADALENGIVDPDEIADAVGVAVTEAIEQGMVEFIDNGAAIQMIEAAVASIDWTSIGTGFAETNSVQVASLEAQLAALYAEKEVFTLQADPSIATAQKQVRDSSKQALDTLKEAQAELAAGWKATMNGVITECNVAAGAQTTLLETGIKLENQKTMTVNISLGEYDIHKVKVGMPATIKTAYGEYTGEIATIAPTATGGSQGSILDSVGSMAGISGLSSLTSSGAGVKCAVTVNEPDENIIAGFDASVEVLVGEHKGIPVVPIESMVLEKEGTYVYLYNEEDETVTKTKIETGAISDSAYEIKSGLAIGDQIVATPTTYKEDSFKVKVSTKK